MSNKIIGTKKLHSDFWKQFGLSFSIFSMYCHYDDWRNILDNICIEIGPNELKHDIKILDIGSGTGKNITEITEMFLSRYNKNVTVDVVEPSKSAQNVIQTNLIYKKNGGHLNNIFSDISEIEMNKYDIILLMHSSYYIKNFEDFIIKIFSCNLNIGGRISILSLPANSVFFLNENKLKLPNTSETICNFLRKNHINFNVKKLSSRFSLNGNASSPKSVDLLYKFITREEIKIEKFHSLYKKYINKQTVNFNDELITIKNHETRNI
jgi:SAM-dependent methyltransferase